MEKPTIQELKKFIEVFDTLCKFEADHRTLRKWGCFSEDEIPIDEVVKVVGWLRSKVKVTEKDDYEVLLDKYEKIADDIHVQMSTALQSNDYATSSSLGEEIDIYENVIEDLKKLGGYGELENN